MVHFYWIIEVLLVCYTKGGPLISLVCGSKYACYILNYFSVCCLFYEKWTGIHIFTLISRLCVYNYACHLTIIANIAEWTVMGKQYLCYFADYSVRNGNIREL
jgi:hypothetical protein